MERHFEQQAEIEAIQKELGDSIRILHASEVEIKADGSLDYPDEFLATLDLVVASCILPCANRARRSPSGCSTPSATRTWTSSATPPDG
jgi:histidinol phosphatase-like PHP family hydrolase